MAELGLLIGSQPPIHLLFNDLRKKHKFCFLMTEKMFDFVVIGGGSGGLAAARRAAAKYGAKVALIESERLGGTCVNLGCVPKKIMYNAASLADSMGEASAYGFAPCDKSSGFGLDWKELVSRRDAYLRKLNATYATNLEKEKVTVIKGKAAFIKPTILKVEQSEGGQIEISGKNIVIATGSHGVVQNVPGSELGITSDGFFALKELPKRVAVIGSGYIGVELAGILQSLGSKVTLWCRKDGVLTHFDSMISKTVTEGMQHMGIELRAMSTVTSIRKDEDKLTVCFKQEDESKECHGYDCLIWAIGRVPNIKGLNLEVANIKTDKAGSVTVDEWQNTSQSNVYALGDVVGHHQLTPVAVMAGRKLVDQIFGGDKNAKMDYTNIPTVVFSHPAPCGTIGLSEGDARKQFDQIKVYESRFTNLYYALMGSTDKVITSYKLICEGSEERVVGLHLYGRGSDEILQGFAVAIKMGATKRDFDACVAIHPTAAEELVTMR